MATQSGTPGLSADGDLPDDIAGQAEIAWGHAIGMLERAGMTVADIIKVTQYLTTCRRHSRLWKSADAFPRYDAFSD